MGVPTQKKTTNDFSCRTPPPPRELPVWHTLCFMRIHGQTPTRCISFCGTEYSRNTVVQGADYCKHAATAGHSMYFMQQLWVRHKALRKYKRTHLDHLSVTKKMAKNERRSFAEGNMWMHFDSVFL